MAPATVATVVVLLVAALRPAIRLVAAHRPVTHPEVADHPAAIRPGAAAARPVVIHLVAAVRLVAIRPVVVARLAAVTRPVVVGPAIPHREAAMAARQVPDNRRPEATVALRRALAPLPPPTALSSLPPRSRMRSCGLDLVAAV
jgi:hypothetical protein